MNMKMMRWRKKREKLSNKIDGGDGEDDDIEEVTVVEETQHEELEPDLKARKKSSLGVV